MIPCSSVILCMWSKTNDFNRILLANHQKNAQFFLFKFLLLWFFVGVKFMTRNSTHKEATTRPNKNNVPMTFTWIKFKKSWLRFLYVFLSKFTKMMLMLMSVLVLFSFLWTASNTDTASVHVKCFVDWIDKSIVDFMWVRACVQVCVCFMLCPIVLGKSILTWCLS